MADELTAEGGGLIHAGIPQRRKAVTAIPGPRSQALADRRARAVSAGVSSVLPVYVQRAGGGVIEDVDGNLIVDLASGIAVTTVGNAAPAVADAVREQVGEYTHTCFMVAPYEPYVAVCELLNDLTPGDHEKRTALFNSGAEAVENAVKVARRATGRTAAVAFDHGYHGRTSLTMALTAREHPYKSGFGPFAPDVYRAPISYPYRDPEGMSGTEAAERAFATIERQVNPGDVAAVVIEPVVGEGGFVEPAPGFLVAVQNWAAEHGVVFVADEIQSGLCRTGTWFAAEHTGVVPDLVTIAKGVAGGMPLSAVTGRAELMDSVHAGGLGGTYGGNPAACAAAVATIEMMRAHDLNGAAARIERQIRAVAEPLVGTVPGVGELRGRGAMMAVEFSLPGTRNPDPDLAAAVAARCRDEGVLVLVCGTDSNVVRMLPPLVAPPELVDDAMAVLRDAIVAAAQERGQGE